MDESRRQALIARFRAGSLERIARARACLAAVVAGEGTPPLVAELLRELHTLKGESRMLGFGELSELAHAVEERLVGPGLEERAANEQPLVAQALAEASDYLRDPGSEVTPLVATTAALRGRPRPAAPAAASSPAAAISGLPAPSLSAAPPAAAAHPGAVTLPVAPVAAAWVQVSASRVDTVCERLAELETEFRALSAQLASLRDREGGGPRRPIPVVRARRAVVEQATRCRSLLEEASDAAWSLRLVPVEPSLRDLAVHARELAQGLGRRVEVVISAGGAEMERSVLDELRQPLLHLVRNAIDHGLEPIEERGDKGPPTLRLSAEPSESGVLLNVVDDGRGVSVDAVRAAAVARGLVAEGAPLAADQILDLLFLHGFSTRRDVSHLSGRGVGLDVVRARVEALGGTVRLSSAPGRGTRVTLDVPAKIAKERALVVAVAGTLFGVPSRWVREVRRVVDQEILSVAGGRALRTDGVDGGHMPLRSLSAVLGATPERGEPWVLIVEWAGHSWAFLAPEVLGEFDLLRRPIDSFVALCGPIAASSVLDDGRLVLLVRPGGLLRRAEIAPLRAPRPAARAPRRPRVLVVDDSPVVRDLVQTLLEAAGLDVSAVDGGDPALQLVEESPPDLVLADVEMPGIDGLELLRRIRLRSDHLPVVMLTTRGSAEDRRRAAELGADAYLVKSEFQERTLVDTVRRFLAGGSTTPVVSS